MKSVLQKSLISCLLFLTVFSTHSFSQDLTGIWRGEFITDGGENYRLEFQVTQNKSKTVTGVSYSYLDTRFYGKATMTGRYTLENGIFTIQEIKTVEVKNMGGGGTCIMNYRFTYSKSGKEEFLEGSYVGKTEDRRNPRNNGVWGDCGGGKVFLRRVQNSDFYVEPFLRNKPELKKQDTATAIAKTPPLKTQAKPKIKTETKPVAKTPQKTPAKNPPLAKTKTNTIKITDTVKQRKTDPIVVDKPVEKTRTSIPVTTRARQNELVKTLTVTSGEINIRLYDNGEIDGDTISVYLDGKPIVTNKGLSTSPITVNLKMDENDPEHTLVMVAENMGKIPPNTSLMIVQDGDKRYSVSITSTEQKNAMVRFRYQKAKE
jgi:hypothetical protein